MKSQLHTIFVFQKKAVEEEEENISVFLQNPKDFIDFSFVAKRKFQYKKNLIGNQNEYM